MRNVKGMCAAGLILAMGMLSLGLDDSASPVQVRKSAPIMGSFPYDPANPNPSMPPPEQGEAGVTVSEFTCTATVHGGSVGETQQNGQFTVTVQINSVDMALGLKVTEWIQQPGRAKMIAHEDGHCKIAQIFYGNAENFAQSAAQGAINKTFTATGATEQEASEKALADAADEISRAYTQDIRDKSNVVQEDYDTITQHGTNQIDEDKAIQQAMAGKGAATQPATQP